MRAGSVRSAIVVPTFNHGGKIGAVLDGLATLGLPLFIVDDGSIDDTPSVLRAWRLAHAGVGMVVIRHEANRGKAAAIRTGAGAAGRAGGITHVVTIDADGQLDPADVPALLGVCEERARALVLGVRPAAMAGCPGRCALGRSLTSLAVRAQTGRRLSDTQCGLRVYPLELLGSVRCASERFAFEAEMVTRAIWAGFEVVEVPIRCRYFAPGERVSHFRPVVDSLRQAAVHGRLLLGAVGRVRRATAGRTGSEGRPAEQSGALVR